MAAALRKQKPWGCFHLTGISPCIAQEHERGHGRNDGNENIKIAID